MRRLEKSSTVSNSNKFSECKISSNEVKANGMKMTKKGSLILVMILIVFAAILTTLLPEGGEPTDAMNGVSLDAKHSEIANTNLGTEDDDNFLENDANPSGRSEAVEGTYRMYVSHASLREEAVANPDSEENKAILQQMVLKGLGFGKVASE